MIKNILNPKTATKQIRIVYYTCQLLSMKEIEKKSTFSRPKALQTHFQKNNQFTACIIFTELLS